MPHCIFRLLLQSCEEYNIACFFFFFKNKIVWMKSARGNISDSCAAWHVISVLPVLRSVFKNQNCIQASGESNFALTGLFFQYSLQNNSGAIRSRAGFVGKNIIQANSSEDHFLGGKTEYLTCCKSWCTLFILVYNEPMLRMNQSHSDVRLIPMSSLKCF